MNPPDIDIPAIARLHLDSDALANNWRVLDQMSGKASAGAAVKADAYGLGVQDVVRCLQGAGCEDFFVANWREANEIEAMLDEACTISVLNGVSEQDMPFALQSKAKPVLNDVAQTIRWAKTGRPCDVMINSGMNRLGINPEDLASASLGDLKIDIVMSHLASADENVFQNKDQLNSFIASLKYVKGERYSLANSAGIALGSEYHFDCTRPGLSLYGGVPRAELAETIRQVAFPQAQILQVRDVSAGDKIGYNAKYTAERDHKIAILAIGYADGYLTSFSGTGCWLYEGKVLPVIGRVSMDLIAADISAADHLREGDWVDCGYDLPTASQQSGLSQYELLTNLGSRLDRIWN